VRLKATEEALRAAREEATRVQQTCQAAEAKAVEQQVAAALYVLLRWLLRVGRWTVSLYSVVRRYAYGRVSGVRMWHGRYGIPRCRDAHASSNTLRDAGPGAEARRQRTPTATAETWPTQAAHHTPVCGQTRDRAPRTCHRVRQQLDASRVSTPRCIPCTEQQKQRHSPR
jgi:hypothetical protein